MLHACDPAGSAPCTKQYSLYSAWSTADVETVLNNETGDDNDESDEKGGLQFSCDEFNEHLLKYVRSSTYFLDRRRGMTPCCRFMGQVEFGREINVILDG